VHFKAGDEGSGTDPIEENSRLGSLLDALLDDLMLLSLQPGNDEDENKAVSDQIDAVHEDGIRLYDDLNRSPYSREALAPLESRYGELRQRADKLITAHGPLRKDLPPPFAALSRELVRWIGLCKQEIHADDADASREKAVQALQLAAAELNDDVIWSGLRHRHEDLHDLQARFATVRAKGSALYP
jgi:hypothetical protein